LSKNIKTAPLAPYERILTFSSPAAAKILKAKNELVLKGRAINARVQKDQQELEKLAMQVQRLADQMIAYAQKNWSGLLKETEESSAVELVNGQVILKIHDKVKLYEARLLEQRRAAAEKAEAEKKSAEKAPKAKAKKA
jgi:hypothetical protein